MRNYWVVWSNFGEHVIEAETGQEAVKIAEEFLIGRQWRQGKEKVPDNWELRGQCHDVEKLLRRSKGRGGGLYYKSESGELCRRTQEELAEWLFQ